MAFTQPNFSCVTNVNGWSQWHYRSSTDALAAIRASGYFNAMANAINTGDLLFIGPDSAGAGGLDMLINTNGVITVAAPALMLAEPMKNGGAALADLKAEGENQKQSALAQHEARMAAKAAPTGDTGPAESDPAGHAPATREPDPHGRNPNHRGR